MSKVLRRSEQRERRPSVNDHSHVWAKTGCYCGATCCEYFGYSDGTNIARASGLLPTGGRFYFCDKPAVDGKHCQFHIIAERYLQSQGSISIAAITREMETGEAAVPYTRQEFEEGR
jgi:hypothetical protein